MKPSNKYEMNVSGDLFLQHCILNLQESPFLCMNPSYNASVWLEKDEIEYLLCNVSRNKNHVNLNLQFGVGENIKLFCKGLGTVQITGQYMVDTFPSATATLLTPPHDEADVVYEISENDTDESNDDKIKCENDHEEEADITEQT